MAETLAKDSYTAAFELATSGHMEEAQLMYGRLAVGAEIGIIRNQVTLLDLSMQNGKFPQMPGLLDDLRTKVSQMESELSQLIK